MTTAEAGKCVNALNNLEIWYHVHTGQSCLTLGTCSFLAICLIRLSVVVDTVEVEAEDILVGAEVRMMSCFALLD